MVLCKKSSNIVNPVGGVTSLQLGGLCTFGLIRNFGCFPLKGFFYHKT